MKQTTLDGGLEGKNKNKNKEKEEEKDKGIEKPERVEYRVYKAKRILNKYKHADSWFWNRYSAHPYVGCEHACEYCYARADKYLHTDRPDDFSRIIKVKRNAPELLRKELQNVRKDVIVTADYQPVESKVGLSRKMLEVVRNLEFPVHVVEKSDLVLKDLDVLKEIHEKSWACISFSFSTLDEDVSRIVEPIAPLPRKRLKAMRKIADAGVLTGANLMPILPFITDSEEMMEDVIRQVKNCGGTFVLVGGLTLDDNVRTRYFRLLKNRFPQLLPKYENLYKSDIQKHYGTISEKAGEITRQYGLKDRIPRYCLNFNQKVAEKLFDTVYRIELKDSKRAWVFRKAAWQVDELEKDIRGIKDVRTLPGIGEKMARVIKEIMEELKENE
ncbi:MAG: radical SAM protein [Theionarchaea archaeon]|nr:radical SAM protein [Theionarchaea archaeon]